MSSTLAPGPVRPSADLDVNPPPWRPALHRPHALAFESTTRRRVHITSRTRPPPGGFLGWRPSDPPALHAALGRGETFAPAPKGKMPPSNAALAKLSIPEVLTKMMFEGDKVNPNWFTKGTPGCALDSLNLAAATPPPAFPPELGSLTELVLLSIRDGAGLVALLRTLRVLRSLKRLRIATCALAELPEELGTLANLEALELSHNKTLKTLPASLGKLPLRTLVVEGNAIAKLPKGLDLDRIAELTFAEPALRTKR